MTKCREGPDKGWSWVIAFACCFVNFLLYGVARLSGLLLVAAVDTFQITRASAALPFSVSTSVRNLSGVFVGHLGQRFGVKPVIAVGCLLASLGAGLCFFATNIIWITICWGGIFGIGFGLATCLLPLAINQYFDKHRGTASGISYSGSYIGSFLFPPIVVLLLENYGLTGTFLVISGGILNILAASMLFHTPSPNQMQESSTDTKIQGQKSSKGSPNSEKAREEDKCERIWYKLVQDFKSRNAFLRFTALKRRSCGTPIYLVKAVPLNFDQNANQCLEISENSTNGQKFITESYDKHRISTVDSLHSSLNASANNTPNFISSAYRKQTTSCTKNGLSKRKLKFRYKKKLAKLKKVLVIPFLNNSCCFKSELQFLQKENVKLISFKYLHCILCPNIASIRDCSNLYSSPSMFNMNDRVTDDDSCLSKSKIGQQNDKSSVKKLRLNEKNAKTEYLLTFQKVKGETWASEHSSNAPDAFTKPTSINSRGKSCCHKLNHNSQYRVSYVPSGPTQSSNLHLKRKSKLSVITGTGKHTYSNSSMRKSSLLKNIGSCFLGWILMFRELMFVVISVTMALHTFVIVCVITIIEDFAADLDIPESQLHYVLMVLSVADLLGTLTLGAVTDRGFMSRCHFIVLCFLGMSITVTAISFSYNFIMLLSLVAIYGIFESGVIITFPLLIAQFIEVKKQAVAIASSNILSSPTVLLVPLVIGHFRDHIGCYSGVFYLLGATLFVCSLIWMFAPYIVTRRERKRQYQLQTAHC